MGTSQQQKAESRERILSAAARQVRAGGLESVVISDLMQSVGLTHGTFYTHFPSRAALLAAALDRALTDSERHARLSGNQANSRPLADFVGGYLSAAHRDAPHKGCPVPSLAADVSRADEQTLQAMRGGVERYVADLSARIGDQPDAHEKAMAAWSTMVGAIALSRLFPGDPLGDAILAAARNQVLESLGLKDS